MKTEANCKNQCKEKIGFAVTIYSKWLILKRQMSGILSGNEWQRVITNGTSMTTNDNELYSESQRMVKQVTANNNEKQKRTISDTEWRQVVQRMRTSDSK